MSQEAPKKKRLLSRPKQTSPIPFRGQRAEPVKPSGAERVVEEIFGTRLPDVHKSSLCTKQLDEETEEDLAELEEALTMELFAKMQRRQRYMQVAKMAEMDENLRIREKLIEVAQKRHIDRQVTGQGV